MFADLQTTNCRLSLEENILAMSDDTVMREIPDQLSKTGLFSEDEIYSAVVWLLEFRRLHHLDVIE